MIARTGLKASYLLFFLFIFSRGQAQLKADFYSHNSSGCAPLLVQFTDSSLGGPVEWEWDLGNGTSSFLQNPSVTYFAPGSYAVRLIIKKNGITDTIVKQNYVTVYDKPIVDFSSVINAGCYPLKISFTDKSIPVSGTLAKWEWDFGDGATSTDKNPQHLYTSSGNYNVTLRVTTSNGCITTLSKLSFIKISNGVLANFTNNSPSLCTVPVNYTFQNLSAGSGTLSYLWNFGDGATSTDKNPQHNYTIAGIYNVSLKVTSSNGCSDIIKKDSLVNIGKIKAAFTTDSITCIGNPIAFTNTSSPSPISVVWNFGDGSTSSQNNPVKTYATTGSYDVKLIANFGNCKDSSLKKITILPKPTASFIADHTASCKIPFTVNFTNNSVNGTTYKWYFSDGDSSTTASPAHVYKAAGNYDVTLISYNVNGCVDTLTYTSYIKIVLPEIQMLNAPDSNCAPFTKQLAYSANLPLFNLTWDLGDGNISHDASPTNTYVNPGKYTVTLTGTTADGCIIADTMVNAIIASAQPKSHFSATPRETCAEIPLSFSDESTGGATKWLWSFGDGATSGEQNPLHMYSDTGYFNIKLIVWNYGCADTLVIPNYVHINAPIAKFTYLIDCKTPFTKSFIDQSIAADRWEWDFGDGFGSSLQNPVHTFTTQGLHEVKLIVYNDSTGCKYPYIQDIPISAAIPNFYASDTFICKNNTVVFTVPTVNKINIANYEWDLGDGIIIPGEGGTASYTYTQPGSYDIKLITTDILGCIDTLIKPKYIHVFGPTAKFLSLVKGTCLNSTVSFQNQSTTDGTHPIKTLIWDFGDGQTDTMHIPGNSLPPTIVNHTYKIAGVYPVTLQVIDSIGCIDSYTIPQPITISQPEADFVTNDTISCPNKPIVFNNLSAGTSLTYSWSFGDNLTTTQKDPTHYYTQEGLYTVRLAVKDLYGCTDTIIKPNYIRIASTQADFILSDSFSTCPPLIVNITDKSKNAMEVQWDFGDNTFATVNNPTHFYTEPGTYIVKQTVISHGGCIDTKQKTIIIRGPIGSFTYAPLTGCKPLTVNFKASTPDKVSFIWDFSDGATLSTPDSMATHTYIFYGDHVPKMILVDTAGCKIAITGKDTIRSFGANAHFNLNKTTFCDSATIAFKDSSTSNEPIVGYEWLFDDGTSSADINATHTYTQTGIYHTRLVVTTAHGCIDSSASATPIRIVASPQIDIANFPNGCVPLNATLNGLLLAPDTSAIIWKWNFGNGNSSSLQDPPSQLYTVAGVYGINLTATNSTGCKTVINKRLDTYPIPVVSAGLDKTICKGKSVQLTASGAASYSWATSSDLSCLNCVSPIATPLGETRYYVTGTSTHGCTDTASVLVNIVSPFKIITSNGDTLCKGESMTVTVSGASTYRWSPTSGINDITSPTPVLSPDSTTTYRVIGSDERKCFTDTAYIPIKVFPIPTVNAGEDKTINVGRTVNLEPIVSSDVTTAAWSPTTGIANYLSNYGVVVKPSENTEYTIEVKNLGGCIAADKVAIFLLCDGSNIYMPNTFSPNSDGVNEMYYPRGIGIFSIKTFRIFTRWGELVYEKYNFHANEKTSGWDGVYKNRKLNPDVYVYTMEVICENRSILTFKGNVTLIK